MWVVHNVRLLKKRLGIAKYFVSGVGVPALKLSFVVIGLSEEELMDEDDSDDELSKTGTFELWL